ncbi:MAG: LysR family transcriptional regulator [Caulobacter sp.]|nr:LysR family transcriptional regulator [Caulobacter sp.]
MVDIDQLRALVEVVESGGFGRAAARLGLSKSIISRRIAALEADLGVRLLARTTRGVSPTEAGLELKLRADSILSDLEEARKAVARSGHEIGGTLRIALPLSFGLRHVQPLLTDMALTHPRLKIDAVYSDGLADLVADRFDAAVRLGVLADSTLVARRIAPIHGVLVASPDYLARSGRPESPADLADHDAVIQSGMRQGESWRFQEGKRTLTIRPRARFRADNGEAVAQAAIAGLGIAMLPTFLVSDAVSDGRLEPLFPDQPLGEAGLYLVRPPGPAPAKVRILTDLMIERFGGEPYWDACALRRREMNLPS